MRPRLRTNTGLRPSSASRVRTAAVLLFASTVPVLAKTPDVAVTIKPIHALVTSVMDGIATPHLLVTGTASPHTYSLKPSDARALNNADVFFRISGNVEPFTNKVITSLPKSVRVITLSETDGLTLLPVRAGSTFEAHKHDDHEPGDHDDHGHAKHKDHDHDGHKDHDDHKKHAHKAGKHDDHKDHHHGHGHKGHDDHADKHGHKAAKHDDHKDHHDGHGHKDHDDHADKHGNEMHDGHIWLDPKNARRLVQKIADVLSEIAPEHRAKLQENAKRTIAEIKDLELEISKALKGLKDSRFIVFHDAYQYFERRFGLNATGAITVSPEVQPSAKRINEIRKKIADLSVSCIFTEPQTRARVVATVTEGTKTKTAVLDPAGQSIKPGKKAYKELLLGLAGTMQSCLAK